MKAREVAYEIVREVMYNGGYSQLVLNKYFNLINFSKEEKDLITKVAYGSIQNFSYLEDQLARYIDKGKTNNKLVALMVTALYQKLYLDSIPDYAILNETVNIARNKIGVGTTTFVNAVLRNFEIEEKEFTEELLEIAYMTSHPVWLVKMLAKHYSEDVAINFCKDNMQLANRCSRINSIKVENAKDLLEEFDYKKGLLAKDAVIFKYGLDEKLKQLHDDGYLTIQDEASQYVSEFANVKRNMDVLDMCAAPGSKTCHIAALMEEGSSDIPLGTIYAVDLYEKRVALIEENCKRLGIDNVKTVVADSTNLEEVFEDKKFDMILVDAPCSGFGVIKRKAEIKYKDQGVLDAIISIQKELLDKASDMLKEDGYIVYSTCTLNKKENEQQVQAFIERKDFVLEEEKTIFGYEHHSDSFYMAKLKKGS